MVGNEDAETFGDYAKIIGLVFEDESERWVCPKCGYASGDSWSQCEGDCPVTISPHHHTEHEKNQTSQRGRVDPII